MNFISKKILTIIFVFVVFSTVIPFVFRSVLNKSTEFALMPERFVFSQPPDWIDVSRLITDTLQEPNLSKFRSVLEPKLTEEFALALQRQPSVKSVRRVEVRYPATIFAEIEYREPVCLIESSSGYWAVDATGVLLPSDYFLRIAYTSPEKLRTYLRVSGITSSPIGGIGEPWGDGAVEKTASLANTIYPETANLGISSIKVAKSDTNSVDFVLVTRKGTEIRWGVSKNAEEDKNKLDALISLHKQHGTLDAVLQKPVVL